MVGRMRKVGRLRVKLCLWRLSANYLMDSINKIDLDMSLRPWRAGFFSSLQAKLSIQPIALEEMNKNAKEEWNVLLLESIPLKIVW